MGLRSFKDDFTGYPNGDLDGQGSTGVWHRDTDYADTIFVNDAGDYVYSTGSGTTIYYNTASIIKPKVYMKVVFSLETTNASFAAGFCDVPIDPPLNYDIHTGFSIYFYPSSIELKYIHNNIWGSDILLGDCAAGTEITVEFVHNYETELFEYLKCELVGYHATDIQGSNISNIPALSAMQSSNIQNKVFSWEWEELGGASPYLSYPRWQPTKFGMRPFY